MDDAGASLQAIMAGMGRTAREGARALRLASPEQRTAAIEAMAEAESLEAHKRAVSLRLAALAEQVTN